MREKHGGFKLAILPIGAYAPRWFMRDQHVDPDEALQIMQILGAQRAMAHHWGTFQLTDEPIEEPPERLRAALARENMAQRPVRGDQARPDDRAVRLYFLTKT